MSTTTTITKSEPKPNFFLNLAVADAAASNKFYTSIGFTPLPDWSDDKTKSLLLPHPNEHVCLMVHDGAERFRSFIRPGNDVVDARKAAQAMFSIAAESRVAVDEWLDKAVAAGGALDPYTMAGHGEPVGMYSRAFEDVDGHIWEVLTMLNGAGSCTGFPEPEKKAE